jgi:hypothetical protein
LVSVEDGHMRKLSLAGMRVLHVDTEIRVADEGTIISKALMEIDDRMLSGSVVCGRQSRFLYDCERGEHPHLNTL